MIPGIFFEAKILTRLINRINKDHASKSLALITQSDLVLVHVERAKSWLEKDTDNEPKCFLFFLCGFCPPFIDKIVSTAIHISLSSYSQSHVKIMTRDSVIH